MFLSVSVLLSSPIQTRECLYSLCLRTSKNAVTIEEGGNVGQVSFYVHKLCAVSLYPKETWREALKGQKRWYVLPKTQVQALELHCVDTLASRFVKMEDSRLAMEKEREPKVNLPA